MIISTQTLVALENAEQGAGGNIALNTQAFSCGKN